MNDYQKYIHKSRYARYLPEKGRRETWGETVNRYIDFWVARKQLTAKEALELYGAIHGMHIMPSMRCMMTAGPALDRDNVSGYNCSYVPVDSPRVFDETMYILMCGTGVGFSVERKYVEQMPVIAEEFHETDTVIVVRDSKKGWATAYKELVSMLYAGQVPKIDISKIRPAGAPLKTFGGRASGPQPLVDLIQFTCDTFRKAAGRRLTTLECHDIMCKIAEIVVVGGVRRSAMISLSNLTDDRMRAAKGDGWFYVGADGSYRSDNPQRALANNSVCYTERPDYITFLKEAVSLYESRSGERGIYNRTAAKRQASKNGRRDKDYDFGTNPCSEIILRPRQFCNLSEVVVRPDDTIADLRRKVELATIVGTLQATLTNFNYLSKAWKTNTEEERLLGVSLTGIMDHPILNGSGAGIDLMATSPREMLKEWLTELKEVAIETNKKWAARLGIAEATAITCVKPSGTVSQLVDSASGIHPRYSRYYIRRVRADKKDPLCEVLKEAGIPYVEDRNVFIFSFPMQAPEGSVFRNDMGALEQLDLWKIYQDNWCEHKPSQTVYYTDDEFLDMMAWVWQNFDVVSGISFFPHSDHVYENAPYEEITEEKYNELVARMPASIDWDSVKEAQDNTEGVQTLACQGGACEI